MVPQTLNYSRSAPFAIAYEQALLFGRAKPVSRECASDRRSREAGELARRLHLLGRLKIVAGIETWAQPDATNWQLYPATANGPLDS